jgi:hypothetical protein
MYNIILILLACSRMFFHPVHLSITNIDINTELNFSEVSCQFFADDFQRIIQINEGVELILGQDQELNQESIDAINNYIFSVFEMKINDQEKISFDFQRKKQDEALIWIHYKGEIPAGDIKSITLVNELMLDIYEDQTNLVIVSMNGEEKGYTFNYRKKTINISY